MHLSPCSNCWSYQHLHCRLRQVEAAASQRSFVTVRGRRQIQERFECRRQCGYPLQVNFDGLLSHADDAAAGGGFRRVLLVSRHPQQHGHGDELRSDPRAEAAGAVRDRPHAGPAARPEAGPGCAEGTGGRPGASDPWSRPRAERLDQKLAVLSSFSQATAPSQAAWAWGRANPGAYAGYGLDWSTDYCSDSPDQPLGFDFRLPCWQD